MSNTLVPEQAAVAATPVTSSHPTACPSWCRERHSVAASAPLQTTAHLSPTHKLLNPQPMAAQPEALLQAELFQLDERADLGLTRLYVSGAGDAELDGPEADIFIAQMQAFVDTLRVLRRQMGHAG